MKAILLAAGMGTRIASEIGQTPKSLLGINGKPLIVHTVELLQKNHIEVIIITGYKHRMIEETLKNFRIKVYYNPFFRVTNSIGSLWYARNEFDTRELFIANADVYYTQEMLDKIFAAQEDNFLLCDVTRKDTGDYFFKSDSRGILERYGKDLPLKERTSEYVGISVLKNDWVERFRSRLCEMIENGEYDLWWENVLYSFVGQEDIYTLDVDGLFWGEVDTAKDYQRVKAGVTE